MADANKPSSAKITAPSEERLNFKALLASNLNYFGNLAEFPQAPKQKIVGDTTYEQLTCVGYNPETGFLEGTLAVKLPFGYGGGLCGRGTTEYVRFFLDYGSGWEDQGLAGVRVHDIPTSKDCAGVADKPLTYVASLRIRPKARCCTHPVLPKVRAILSWQWIPPAGNANAGWQPVWGNVLDCAVQIKPRPWSIFCLFESLSEELPQKIKVPPLFEEVQFDPIPQPDPPPPLLSELAATYSQKAAGEFAVAPHRFGFADLQSALASGAFEQETAIAKAAEFKAAGLDFATAIAALQKTKADVTYEELECLGIDDNLPERLVATFRIKRPTGYSGTLCYPGSQEYVAFWADWDNTCEWTYLGTVKVNVHDIPAIPRPGLCYSAILPVDLTYHRRHCTKPKIARVRAVLSWAVPPSTTDPDALTHWGNRLDTHVQIVPGEEIDPGKPLAKIRNLGGIPVEDIDTAGTGLTLPTAHFFYDYSPADSLGRACPFGGSVLVHGQYYLGYYYRVKARRVGDPPMSFSVLSNSFYVERWDVGFDLQSSSGGFFPYLNPALYLDRKLAVWPTSGDDLWEVQLDIATAPNTASIIASSPWYRLQLDNTRPEGPPASPLTMDIHIDAMGDCKDFTEGVTITGTFVARDTYFGHWSLSTEPNTLSTPSNPPIVSGLASTSQTPPAPGGYAWQLNTDSPVHMKPCGYVVRLDVSDRSIVNSLPGVHNWNHIEVGFCLRAKK